MKTCLRYAGGKTKAFKYINPYVTTEDKVVSPFIGGGSMESQWAKDKQVIGYDVFKPLTIWWNQLLTNNTALADELSKLSADKETYNYIKGKLLCWDYTQDMLSNWKTDYYVREPITLTDLEVATYYYHNHQLSYGPMYLGWMSKIYQDNNKWNRMIDKIQRYDNPNLSVFNNTFDEVIPNHSRDFLYLDPPYYLTQDGDNKMFKGIYPNANIDVHHTGFNHELLRDLLHSHKGKFVLSYNNCATIREYYKDFELVYPSWHYSYALGEKRIGANKVDNTPKESHEILIIKR
jgi:DNA adenine methylase